MQFTYWSSSHRFRQVRMLLISFANYFIGLHNGLLTCTCTFTPCIVFALGYLWLNGTDLLLAPAIISILCIILSNFSFWILFTCFELFGTKAHLSRKRKTWTTNIVTSLMNTWKAFQYFSVIYHFCQCRCLLCFLQFILHALGTMQAAAMGHSSILLLKFVAMMSFNTNPVEILHAVIQMHMTSKSNSPTPGETFKSVGGLKRRPGAFLSCTVYVYLQWFHVNMRSQ